MGTPAEILTTTCHYVGISVLVHVFGHGVVFVATDAAPHFGVDRTQAAVTDKFFVRLAAQGSSEERKDLGEGWKRPERTKKKKKKAEE